MCKKSLSLKELLGSTFWLRWRGAWAGWWGWGLKHRAELRTLSAGPAETGHTQASLTTSNFFFPLPGFWELHWNTKPRCQRHLASAVFHHKTLRHENFLACNSSDARSACCALALLERLPGWATVPPGSISCTQKSEFIFRFGITSCVTATPSGKHTLSHLKPFRALNSLQLSLASFSWCS